MNVLIYDTEIKRGVPTANNPEQPGYLYADDWTDFITMGIAVLTAYDVLNARAHIFLADNLNAFQALLAERDALVGWNNWKFDDRLLEAHGIAIPEGKTIDLAALVWRAAGIPQGERPSGLGLDAVCRANGLPGKTGNGADAPQDWQDGRHGRVMDYCLGDVYATLRLYRQIAADGGCSDPRDGRWLTVTVPQ